MAASDAKSQSISSCDIEQFCPGAHFMNDFFHRISNLVENWFWCNSIVGYYIAKKNLHMTRQLSCPVVIIGSGNGLTGRPQRPQ